MVGQDEEHRYVCHECIGDAYLKNEIERIGAVHTCMICDKRQKCTDFEELCDRIHVIMTEDFERVSSDSYSYYGGGLDLERSGDGLYQIFYEIIESEGYLLDEIKEYLSNCHYSYDDAAMGEENPYGDETNYRYRKPSINEALGEWAAFETEIRSRSRFFNRRAEVILNGIFAPLARFKNRERDIIRDAGPGTNLSKIFRARRATTNAEIARIVENPIAELGAPPSRHAGSGRMNPRWIPMFYGARDAETCVAEIRPPVGSAVVIGQFDIIRKLRLLDLTALQDLYVEEASYFDPVFRTLKSKADFLGKLVGIMSQPVTSADNDYEYLPTQFVVEFLSEKFDENLDGIIFHSSQSGGEKQNIVLFQDSALVEAAEYLEKELETDFGWATDDDFDDSITVWFRKADISPQAQKSSADEWIDLPVTPQLPPTLRLELTSIEVRKIVAVAYDDSIRRRVSRFQKTEGDDPF
ncbi:RES family NAD+ phosphorylase [Methylopila henanensis]|uniref:RES family NAD+ phosphorylase n=1 Tax=Methylopila henanensis TaxID=873516 RepID=A0ABW4K4E4_9HYPH